MAQPVLATSLLEPETADFYREVMNELLSRKLRFLVGGAYAFGRYTGIERHTKDFDIFVMKEDCERVLSALADLGCYTEMSFPHWLAKGYRGDDFVDVIFSSGCGIAVVDKQWFQHAVEDEVLGVPVRLCPAEEIIWSKSFIQERERFDGGDVLHLLLHRGPFLDWDRLLARFGRHWRVLFAHLVTFGYAFPAEAGRVPERVVRALLGRLEAELLEPGHPSELVCRGTLLSRAQYLPDLERGYRDARTDPDVQMTKEDIAHWTRAIEQGGKR